MAARVKHERRLFLGAAARTLTAASLGLVAGVARASEGQSSAARPPKNRPLPPFGPVKQIDAGLLNVGYVDLGPAAGYPVILLHGWPYDIHSYERVAPSLASAGYRAIVPYLRGYGTTRFLSPDTVRNAQQSVVALDVIALLDALKIQKAIIAGFDWGSRTAATVAALWPERCRALVAVSGYLITSLEANLKPLPPVAEYGWWYQYYFATERGRLGYAENRRDFNKLIWRIASPRWRFDDATYGRTAESFENPDHVQIVIHNYRWRLSLAQGEPRYDDLEKKLFARPVISVPTITIASDFDGPAADGAAYAKMFSGTYSHRILKGIGHNVPQEAPEAFARAVLDVAASSS
ncbi:MAG TPA: alpha/beta hydrolase [Myxococcaceae bacterium]|nr:alpha/beta hydrolase [Myxococcaceae bacterium]